MTTAFEIREELIELVRRDLLGPADGPEEELDPEEARVSSRYPLGRLAPGGRNTLDSASDAEEMAAMGEAEASASNVELEDGAGDAIEREPVLVDSLLLSSAGFSCVIDPAETEILIRAEWGHYERVDPAAPPVEPSRRAKQPKSVWKRFPVRPQPVKLTLQEGSSEIPLDADQPVQLAWRVRKRSDGWHLTLFIINAAAKKLHKKDERWIFQTRLCAESPSGRPIFLPLRPAAASRDLLDAQEREEMEGLDLRYRHKLLFARGHGAAARAEEGPEPGRASRIELDFLPIAIVPGQTPRTGRDDPLLEGMILDMKELAKLPPEALRENLDKLANAYQVWTDNLQNEAADFAHAEAVARARQEAAGALLRMREGIATLVNDSDALAAFRFANEAMWKQRIHTVFSRIANTVQGGAAKLALLKEVDVPENRSWRLFQLAFILSNVPGLVNPLNPGRSGENASAELLWFSTGGGKTEAYLGLTAFTLAMRRLKPNLGGLDAMHGVGVFMRYTLRLLTLQQFQRAAALICACEYYRRKKPELWGSEPFRLGLWVGAKSTPNSLEAARLALGKYTGHGQAAASPQQLNVCPWCGSKVEVRVRDNTTDPGRCLAYCADTAVNCPFTEKNAPLEGLPVMVVDEEIYRRPPALLIATVDKFARMPWKGEIEMLFGRVTGLCSRHGFVSPDVDEKVGATHRPWKSVPAATVEKHGWLRPPDLIIQDELHLISGPLGSMTGLYENAIDALCQWRLDGQTVRPMVIASTATIRRAPEQIRRLFNRAVEVFPPPGVDSGDNFFALERPVSPECPGRAYMGICAIGNRLPPTMVRVYATVMGAAQLLYEKYGEKADPWMTAIGYFNSIRELAGMQRLVRDQVRARLAGKYRRGLARRRGIVSEELTSRQSSRNIPYILDTLGHDIGAKSAHRGFYDVLLATNMISVGVDVDRLGLMIVQGQPRNTSEYIQATSRVGRAKNAPGLVLAVYNWARPRDLSHYEDFYGYHAAFQRHVEALSVTPFASRALDRGLAATLVSLVRLLDTEMNGNRTPKLLLDDDRLFREAKSLILERATQILQNNREIAALEKRLDTLRDDWLKTARKKRDVSLDYSPTGDSAGLLCEAGTKGQPFACPNSLRDVEKTIQLILNTDESGLSV